MYDEVLSEELGIFMAELAAWHGVLGHTERLFTYKDFYGSIAFSFGSLLAL
jgi:hypothetical protein